MENYQKISTTMQEMMTDRKYFISKTFDQFNMDDLFIPMLIATNDKDETIIVYITYKKIGKKEILKFQEIVESKHVILISKFDLTSQAKKLITNVDNVNIELFLHKHVLFNITKHDLQPKFTLLNTEELKKICEEFQCTVSELPKMSVNDPIARYYYAKTKNVFKIMRRDNIYFRVVI